MKKLIGLLTGVILLWNCTPEITPQSSLLYYVAPESQVILKIRDFQGFKRDLKNNAFLQQASKTGAAKSISEAMHFFNYLRHPGECIMTLVPYEGEELHYVFATALHDSVLDMTRIDSTSVIENKEFKTIEVDGRTIYGTSQNGNLIFSSSSELLTGLINNVGKRDVDSALNALYGAANANPSATVILKVDRSSPVAKKVVAGDEGLNYTDFANWFSFDINTGQNELALNGITLVGADSTSMLSLFKNTRPLSHKTPLLAPSNTLATLSFTFDSHREFSQNQLPFLRSSAALDTVFHTVEEIGFIHIGQEKAIVLQTFGTENITDYLNNLQSEVSDYQGKEIIALKEPRFLNVQFTPLIKEFDANYYTILENAFVFSENQSVLQGIIRNYNSGNTLNTLPLYTAVTSGIADESHIQFLATSGGVTSVLRDWIREPILDDFREINSGEFAYAAQVVADHEFYHTNISVQKITKQARQNTATALFTVQLDEEVATDPQFVTNHRTGQKEIVVQDESNALYLISNQGKILWKKDVGSRIQGKVHQVDLYKNGRLQLAFTTNTHFYILDRNGRTVKPFSIKFDGGNLNPLAVFDYDNNRNYRFVVTQGTKVYMYNRNGDIVKGFTYQEAPSAILQAPGHFRIGKRDYLVFTLEDGSLEILNRVGKTRISVGDKIDFSGNPVYLYRDKFTVSDKRGRLYQYDTNGKRTTTRLNLNEFHGMDATSKTLATINDNILSIKGRKTTLDLGVYTAPRIFYIGDTIYVSVTDLQSQQVYMFYSNSRSLPGFPVYGGSKADMADMDNDRKLEMVTRDQKESLVVYRLN